MDKRRGFLRAVASVLIVSMVTVLCAGCTRMFYRKSADREVNAILQEKDVYPEWKIEQWHVTPDPRARFADPVPMDHPPMPPDDEAAWKLSPHPQKPGHAGVGSTQSTGYLEMIKVWDQENRAEWDAIIDAEKNVGGADWLTRQPIKHYFDEERRAERTGFVLNLEQAVELGVVNSPQYQTMREQLYLAALPVTRQRYNFAYQWAATADFIRQWADPAAGGDRWTGTSSIGFTKLFSSGAFLTADFINSTVWNLSGAHGMSSQSTIGVDLVQPLLQGGGKAVTLEPLAQAERNLVYAIRSYARFREQYYVSVALGSSLPNTLAGVGSASTGSVSNLAALGIAATDVAGGLNGFLPVLYRQCDLAVDKKLVSDLQRALKILEGYQEGGMFSPLQVDQVRSTLMQAQNTVASDQQFVNNALDQLKLALGLPANMPLILDDAPARPITRQLDRYYEVIADADAASRAVEQQDKVPPEKLRAALLEIFTKDQLVRGTQFQKKIAPAWASWEKLTEAEIKTRLTKLGEERRKLLDIKTDLDLKGQSLSPKDAEQLREGEFQADLGGLEQLLRRLEARPWEKAKGEQARQERIKTYRLVGHAVGFVLVWARNERFDTIGTNWPTLPPSFLEDLDLINSDVDLAQEKVVQAALAQRVDLMNARAVVVDAWRQLRVTANALMGVVNVGYKLESETPAGGSHPFAFSPASTVQQLKLDFQLPLNRIAQRNAYRNALINYQQARRALMSLEDNIAAQVRFDVRQLRLFGSNYKVQKLIVQSLYSQVDSALEYIVAPSDPDQLRTAGTTGQANAAALTNQYLSSINQLNGAQLRMYDIWLSFLATRMQLYLDLERLPLDLRGVWTDELGRTPVVPPEKGQEEAVQRPRLEDGGIPLVFIDHPLAGRGSIQPTAGTSAPAQTVIPAATPAPRTATFGAPSGLR